MRTALDGRRARRKARGHALDAAISGLGGVSAGADHYRFIDARFEVALGRWREVKSSKPPLISRYPFLLGIRMSWDWLPVRTYMTQSVPPHPRNDGTYSASWTGRSVRLIAIGRWRYSFGLLWKGREIFSRYVV
jgi:hypothetical protein